MNNLAVINSVSVEFSVVGEEVFADTLKIAEVFEKRHTDILRAIDNLPNDGFKSSNFKFDTYFDKKGEQRRMFSLTRDGFSLLVMGFTGEKAYQWKIEFIKAFNTIEAELKRQGVIRYTDKIADLEASQILQTKRHADQINGYKGQLAKHNALIASLKTELAKRGKIYDAEVIERYEDREENLRAQLHNAKAERDFYFKRTQELKQKQNVKDSEIVRILNKIQIQMDGVYSEIGAVMAYANDNDRFFIEQNQILKG